MIHRARQFLRWLGGHGPVVLIAFLVVVAGTWGFVELMEEVGEGDTKHIDEAIIRYAGENRGPLWLQEAGRDVTALGGVAVLAIVTAAVAGYYLLIRKYGSLWLILGATIGGLLISTVLKEVIDRQRPDLFEHQHHVYTSSFPSGHSFLSAVVYLTLGSLLTRLVQGRMVKLYFLGMALFLTFLIGVSRVYMLVHWPTDVLAGWTAGLVWALFCWLLARSLQRRGKVEKARTAPPMDDDDPEDDVGAPARPVAQPALDRPGLPI
jgi:undecaprenyl-diphosphatase